MDVSNSPPGQRQPKGEHLEHHFRWGLSELGNCGGEGELYIGKKKKATFIISVARGLVLPSKHTISPPSPSGRVRVHKHLLCPP